LADRLPDERPLPVDLVRFDRTVPVARCVGSRNPGASAQLNILQRKSPNRVTFSDLDWLIFTGLFRRSPNVLDNLKILKPETIIRWHRAGFHPYWRRKSRPFGGRPMTPEDIRKPIYEMGIANPLWGAPRIHGELLKLGINVGQTIVAKYMAKRRGPPPQDWKTFLRNHADAIALMDMFVVPTISFRLLYGLVILRHCRRELVWLGVTTDPNAEWIARQVTEAFGWEKAPAYIIRDRDGAYGEAFIWRIRAMGIRDRPTSPHAPWQNGYAERFVGSIRWNYLDHVVIFGERHLHHLFRSYQKYYNEARTQLSLCKDVPVSREVRAVGRVIPVPMLGGLHHQYVRI
jgi:transposase InsO family protein